LKGYPVENWDKSVLLPQQNLHYGFRFRHD
jgi:hypothetical protein